MKVFILFDNEDMYATPIIAIVSTEERAEALRKNLQSHYVQEITIDVWVVDAVNENDVIETVLSKRWEG